MWRLRTAVASLFLMAASLWGSEPASFWVLRFTSAPHPWQEKVEARKISSGKNAELFATESFLAKAKSGLPEAEALLKSADTAWDALAALVPEVTLEKPIVVLLGEFGWAEPAFYSPFDKLTEQEAVTFGFHSNERPVVYVNLLYSGEQSWRNHACLAEQIFLQALVPKNDPFPATSSLAAAKWFAFHLGLAPPRVLWGDEDHGQTGPPSWSPQNEAGWSPLFMAFLADFLGPKTVVEMVRKQNTPTGPYVSLLADLAPGMTSQELFRIYMDRLWWPLASPTWQLPLAGSPRPAVLAQARASRPYSGQVRIGRGGTGLIVLQGDGGKSLPLSFQGESSAVWVGFVCKATRHTLAPVFPVSFDNTGFAQLEIPPLAAGERLLVFLGVLPESKGNPDDHLYRLQWGLAWSPKAPSNRRLEQFRQLAEKRLGQMAPSRRSRIMASLRKLSGLAAPGESTAPVTTRYAWHPVAAQVVEILLEEARARGLAARSQAFLRTTPWGVTAEWRNVLIELPGSGSPRLPLVLAAHWDACTANPWQSFRAARSLTDNALGVAIALEVASTLRVTPHVLPVTVALLAGGCHDAAGAQALLASLGGKVAAWVELEQLGPGVVGDPTQLEAFFGETMTAAAPRLPGLFRRWGFSLRVRQDSPPNHVGSSLAARQGALAIALTQSRALGQTRTSPQWEFAEVSPDGALLLAGALADLIQELGGR